MSTADPKKEPTGTAVVAERRTVMVEGKECAPGTEVVLPMREIRRLRSQGYPVDPNAKKIPVGNGPVFRATEGPSLKAVA